MTAFIEAASPHTMNTYGRLPIALSHGQGCRVWDINGKPYLDALGGIAVNTLGHNHPKLVPALQDQIGKIIHSCNYYHVPNQEKLAAKLVELSGLTNVFFCSTGLEANEAALKLARKFGHDKGVERPEIIVYEKAFHGRSIATLSATGNPKVQAGFGPLVEGFPRVPLNDIAALREMVASRPNVPTKPMPVADRSIAVKPSFLFMMCPVTGVAVFVVMLMAFREGGPPVAGRWGLWARPGRRGPRSARGPRPVRQTSVGSSICFGK